MNGSAQWLTGSAAVPNETIRRAAAAHQRQLTKPPGSLGVLESAAADLAAQQGRLNPGLDRVHIAVFAADHGVAVEGVSAFPQAVTGQMIRNFARGGAAIAVLAQELNATLEIIDLGTRSGLKPIPGVRHQPLGRGTANLRRTAAMNRHQLEQALCAGRQAVQRARLTGAELFIGGEMGIANTTAATATACALLSADPGELAGPGTGLDPAGVRHKSNVIRDALALHGPHLTSLREALRRLSGFEIAALCGAFVACGQTGLPCLVDGFIASTAALAAVRINPAIRPWLWFGHRSAEPGHGRILQALDAEPLLNLGLRLGEGSGAAIAVATLRLACALHNRMATFSQAEVHSG